MLNEFFHNVCELDLVFNFYKVSLWDIFFFSELCWGKAMVAYTMPQQKKKEEGEKLRGERDNIKFIDLGFERWQVVRFRKARGRSISCMF